MRGGEKGEKSEERRGGRGIRVMEREVGEGGGRVEGKEK